MSLLSTPPTPVRPAAAAPERPRFLSEADCRDLLQRLAHVAHGGGHTAVAIHSVWTGNVRWARNQISTSGDVRNNIVEVSRVLNGARNGSVTINDLSDAALVAAARRAERLAQLDTERPQTDLLARYPLEALPLPTLFSEATYQLDTEQRAVAAEQLAQSAAAAGMLSAGYVEVSAHSLAILDTFGRVRYFPYTQAQYSVTVRDPKGTGSGWAGVDFYDWAKIDGPKLSQLALEKCLTSRNPVKIEPGRYTTILEPQAVCDFVGQFLSTQDLDRRWAEGLWGEKNSPFRKTDPQDYAKRVPGYAQLGDRVIDERLSLGADPTDPELGFPPFYLFDGGIGLNAFSQAVYHPVTWIDRGVLTHLAYERRYGVEFLKRDTGLPNSGAFRMSVTGPTSSVEEMIASTKRGLLVTRFDQVMLLMETSVLCRGNTRDGLWLIENGKISRPVHNLVFTESVLFALNQVEAVGVPQRVFHPPISGVSPTNPQPVIVPALKIKDFSFTALDDAV